MTLESVRIWRSSGDASLGDVEVGDVEVGDVEVGDVEVGDVEVGDVEVDELSGPGSCCASLNKKSLPAGEA